MTTDVTDRDTQVGQRPPSRRGNRVLLAAGLGAALASVGCLGLLQAAEGSAAPATTAAQPAAEAHSMAQSQEMRPAAAAAAPDHTMKIADMKFAQTKMTVKVGETVKWVNEDTAPHTVTATSGPAKFDSGTMEKGDSWSYTFTKPGTYEYYCAVHPDMVASITVEADDSGGSTGGSDTGGSGSAGGTGGSDSGGSTGGTGGTGGGSAGGSTGGSSGGSSGGHESGGSMGGATGGSSGGSGGGDDGDDAGQCQSVQQVLLPILQHLNKAHLEESPGQQVQDALKLDSYIKMHTVWVESILTPAVEGGGSILDGTLSVLLQHVNKAHLEESPGQQVADILNPDAYVKMHTVWAEHLLEPSMNYVTTSC